MPRKRNPAQAIVEAFSALPLDVAETLLDVVIALIRARRPPKDRSRRRRPRGSVTDTPLPMDLPEHKPGD